MCLVTRTVRPEAELIRFVCGPDGIIVPDIRARLPGRGVWITAERSLVEQAARRNVFSRGLKSAVGVPDDLAERTSDLLAAAALGRLGLARKAGQLAVGQAKVSAAVGSGQTGLVLIASDAAPDSRRKMQAQARRRPDIAAQPGTGRDDGLIFVDHWSSEELSLAIGRTNVIHAAVLAGPAGRSFEQAVLRLLAYEGRAGEDAVEPQDSDV